MQAPEAAGFSPHGFGSASMPGNASPAAAKDTGPGSYGSTFGSAPTNMFIHAAAWQAEDSQQRNRLGLTSAEAAISRPGAESVGGSRDSAPSDEKDPFLSLLEQLAEQEQRISSGSGTGLELFFAGHGNPG
ncbi:hypothetical protein CDD83_6132 [Cordyceps sp. RAO-2017]|nr:hypothetical protein CDD83_6132 [Cordyceps sp. RAO-2017]